MQWIGFLLHILECTAQITQSWRFLQIKHLLSVFMYHDRLWLIAIVCVTFFFIHLIDWVAEYNVLLSLVVGR